jgi:hypothetical protein
MTDKHLNTFEKQAELEKFRDLVLATLDYYLDNKEPTVSLCKNPRKLLIT